MSVDSSLCGITHLYPHWRFSSQPSTASIVRGNIWNYSFLFYLFKKSTKGRVCICKIVDHFISFVKVHWHSWDHISRIFVLLSAKSVITNNSNGPMCDTANLQISALAFFGREWVGKVTKEMSDIHSSGSCLSLGKAGSSTAITGCYLVPSISLSFLHCFKQNRTQSSNY